MVRPVLIALGLGLVILWIAGLSYHSPAWQVWAAGGLALLAFVSAWAASAGPRVGGAGAAVIALGLFLSWIIALGAGGAYWLAWWTFGFACAFLVVASATFSGAGTLQPPRHA